MKKAAAAPKAGSKKAKPKAWAPVSVAAQRAAHAAANKKWKPVPVAVQRARHHAALVAAAKAAAAAKGTASMTKVAPGRVPMVTHAKKARKLALGDGVACCAAEAVAASLRLAGRPVSDADVLALYRRTAGGPDAGASIVATLEAAAKFGLAGVRPVSFGLADLDLLAALTCGNAKAFTHHPRSGDWPDSVLLGIDLEEVVPDECPAGPLPLETRAGLILGLELPGPHAVLDDGLGWWSWGDLYDPDCWPDAVIEEAWTLAWD